MIYTKKALLLFRSTLQKGVILKAAINVGMDPREAYKFFGGQLQYHTDMHIKLYEEAERLRDEWAQKKRTTQEEESAKMIQSAKEFMKQNKSKKSA